MQLSFMLLLELWEAAESMLGKAFPEHNILLENDLALDNVIVCNL